MMVDAHMKDGRTFRLERDRLIELMERDLLDQQELASVSCWSRWRRDDRFESVLMQKISPGSIGYVVELHPGQAQAFLAERLEQTRQAATA